MNFSLLAYPGILVGVFFEGEFFFLSAIIAAHSGHLDIPIVLFMGFLGAFSSDIFFFYIGRQKGLAWVYNKPRLNKHFSKVNTLIDKNERWLLVTYRFMYGLRTIIPVLLGTRTMSAFKFITFSFFGNILWTAIIAFLGLAFGALILSKLHQYEKVEFWIIGILAMIGLVFYFATKRKEYQQKIDQSTSN